MSRIGNKPVPVPAGDAPSDGAPGGAGATLVATVLEDGAVPARRVPEPRTPEPSALDAAPHAGPRLQEVS